MGGVGQEFVLQAIGPGQFEIGQLQIAVEADQGHFLFLHLAHQILGVASIMNHGHAAHQVVRGVLDPHQAHLHRDRRAVAMPGHDGEIIHPALSPSLGQHLVQGLGVGIKFAKMAANDLFTLQAVNVLANLIGVANDPVRGRQCRCRAGSVRSWPPERAGAQAARRVRAGEWRRRTTGARPVQPAAGKPRMAAPAWADRPSLAWAHPGLLDRLAVMASSSYPLMHSVNPPKT